MGFVPESAWPENALAVWPPSSEPPDLDALAKKSRLGLYQRVRTVQECKSVLVRTGPVLVSFNISDQWFDAPSGLISLPSPGDTPAGSHAVAVVGYDDNKAAFKFMNSWGVSWGDHGFGYIPYDVFETIWHEGWLMDMRPNPPSPRTLSGFRMHTWGVAEHGGGCFIVVSWWIRPMNGLGGHLLLLAAAPSRLRSFLSGRNTAGNVMERS